jgi:ankyrin repeat protein/Ca2+-binding EF-hand superfamily protein
MSKTRSQQSRGTSTVDARASTKTEKDQFAQVEKKSKEVFRLADEDLSGSIQFTEFVYIHEELMTLTSEINDPCCSPEELEKQFRLHDSDNNLSLDYGEFQAYLEGILSLIGHRRFLQVCDLLLEQERMKKASGSGEYVATTSNLLLEKVANCQNLHGAKAEEVLALLAKRANPNFFDHTGSNVLLYVAAKGDVSLIERIIEARGDPMKHNRDMDCAIFAAARARNLEALQVMMLSQEARLEAKNEDNTLSRKLVKGMGDATTKDVTDLLKAHANPDFRDESGWTPLTSAVFWGKQDCAQALLTHAKNTNQPLRLEALNARGRAALHTASRKGLHEIVRLLVREHADPELRDSDGWTALHHAAFNGQDDCVKELVKVCSLVQLDREGFTPWMLATCPSRTSELGKSALELIEPPESTNFSKKVIPILASTELSTYDKLAGIYGLPGVCSNPVELRLHEHFFSARSGPNKVRLQKSFEGLVQELLRRQRSRKSDLEPPGPHMCEAAQEERSAEIRARCEEQTNFLDHWLNVTMGPPQGPEWHHTNREAYDAELEETINAELLGFQAEFDALLASAKEEDRGQDLCKIPALKVVREHMQDQISVHPILGWMDVLRLDGCLQSLRSIDVPGFGEGTHNESLIAFMDFIIQRADDFSTGVLFWQNIYKLWLSQYAKLADRSFQEKIQEIVHAFTSQYAAEGLELEYHQEAPRGYDGMKKDEAQYGEVAHDSVLGRRVSSHFLDVMRCRIVANSPRAIVVLLEEFFEPNNETLHKIVLTRVRNDFHPDSQHHVHGYRELVLNVFFNGGDVSRFVCGSAQQQGKKKTSVTASSNKLGLIGEVRITLKSFDVVRKRMHLLAAYAAGEFDHPHLDEDQFLKK